MDYYLALLTNSLIGAGRGKIGAHRVLAHGRARGQVEDGHVVAEGLGDAAHGVLRARPALGYGHTEFLTIVQAAVAVRGHECAPLLTKHDGADTFLGYGLDQIVGREAGYPLHALQL